jgi:hypothetical protein
MVEARERAGQRGARTFTGKTSEYHRLKVRLAEGAYRRGLTSEQFSLAEDSLISFAEKLTGLCDWGDDDFRHGLRVLLSSYEKESRLTALGRALLRADIVQALANRLKIRRDLQAHPEIRAVPIERPIFVIGLPRSGTTLLHNLLAQDPTMRVPRRWELRSPSPPPELDRQDTDPRIKETQDHLDDLHRLAPELPAVHPLFANGPDECHWLLRNAFCSKVFELSADVPSYAVWLDQQACVAAYREYREQLQLLTWRWRGQRIVLKDPFHLWSLEALLTVFPDAYVVYIHRDPIAALPSIASLCALLRSVVSDDTNLHRIGEEWLEKMAVGLERSRAARALGRGVSCDVLYDRLVADPLSELRRIYTTFGVESSTLAEQNVNAWLKAHSHTKPGVHRYDLAQFGLSRERLVARIGPFTPPAT